VDSRPSSSSCSEPCSLEGEGKTRKRVRYLVVLYGG
jgi:hypothetical protein